MRFFAKEELISQLVRPLGQYALSVSAPSEKLNSLIIRRRTNRGSTVGQKAIILLAKTLLPKDGICLSLYGHQYFLWCHTTKSTVESIYILHAISVRFYLDQRNGTFIDQYQPKKTLNHSYYQCYIKFLNVLEFIFFGLTFRKYFPISNAIDNSS